VTFRREVILPADPAAPKLARQALGEVVPPPALNERSADLLVALSELVTNAVLRARLTPDRDTIRLVIERDLRHVRVEVEQGTSPDGMPAVEVGRGYGLRIVDALADDWGVEPGPPGHVWFGFTA
jgi:anti-sigma regulatory factor (Ser/Thr protein kinase)